MNHQKVKRESISESKLKLNTKIRCLKARNNKRNSNKATRLFLKGALKKSKRICMQAQNV